MSLRRLDIHGLRVALDGDWDEVVDQVARDYQWFGVDANPEAEADLALRVQRRAPDFAAYGELEASFVTPRNVVYAGDARTVVDYFGKVLLAFDARTGEAVLQGEDAQLVHEAAYQCVLSRIGRHLDERRLVRIHGLGLAGREGAVVLLLPSGGGKTTLALRALADPACRLLSEDSPLVDGNGLLHPFPLRMGVNATDADLLPGGEHRRMERMEMHSKFAVEVDGFMDRIEPAPQPLRHIVVGRRTLSSDASLERLAVRRSVRPLLREAVVGVGLYQGMEFVLQRGSADVLGKLPTALRRSRCVAAGLRGAETWRLRLGRDRERNWAELKTLLI